MKPLFSIILRVLAVLVYVQYIASQFYDPTGEAAAETVYRILDPLLVVGTIIVVYYAYQRKRAVDASSEVAVTREYLEANVVLYFSVALFFGLLWNWVGFQFSNPENSAGWLWAVLDLALPLLFYVTSVQLVKSEE